MPPVMISYWASRTMIGIGLLMVLLASLAVWWSYRDKLEKQKWFLKIMVPAGLLPTIAITAGWLIAETGRWPWIVHGLQKIEDAVSPSHHPGQHHLFPGQLPGSLHSAGHSRYFFDA